MDDRPNTDNNWLFGRHESAPPVEREPSRLTEEKRRRGRTRPAIEDLEAALRRRREEERMREGDW